MIELLNPQLDSFYHDYWGEYLPFELENWWPIIRSGCYVPRFFQAPTEQLMAMVAGDYQEFALQIPAGSFILEILHSAQAGEPNGAPKGATGTFTTQITDVTIDHQWFSNPVPDAFFYKQLNTRNGYALPKPYPVIVPGNFKCEFWCTATGYCELLFAVACPESSRV